jgi:hypothetical protein
LQVRLFDTMRSSRHAKSLIIRRYATLISLRPQDDIPIRAFCF